jgi:hypothetical protein
MEYFGISHYYKLSPQNGPKPVGRNLLRNHPKFHLY